MTARRVAYSLLGALALFLQGLFLPCKPMTVLLAAVTIALREEPFTAGCWGWVLGLLWGVMAGLSPLRPGLLLAGAAIVTAVLHRYLIFTPGRLALWVGCLVICTPFVLQYPHISSVLPCWLFTLALAPLCLWNAP